MSGLSLERWLSTHHTDKRKIREVRLFDRHARRRPKPLPLLYVGQQGDHGESKTTEGMSIGT
jgi:hypothetical protein